MSVLTGFAALLAASVISVPTPPGVPSTEVTARHGSVYQTGNDARSTQGFLEIDNSGAADELTGVTCPIADTTSLVDADGQPVATVTIPTKQQVGLQPGGTHLMLQSLHFSVQYGGIIPCSLTFAQAGTVSVFLYAKPAP